eukprot:1159765-Pelagomonas_calceolata.AAC.7
MMQVDDDRCNRDNRISGEKPLELRACNLDVHCPDRRLKLGALDTSDIYQAGSGTNAATIEVSGMTAPYMNKLAAVLVCAPYRH